jgi:hypothetical protein
MLILRVITDLLGTRHKCLLWRITHTSPVLQLGYAIKLHMELVSSQDQHMWNLLNTYTVCSTSYRTNVSLIFLLRKFRLGGATIREKMQKKKK